MVLLWLRGHCFLWLSTPAVCATFPPPHFLLEHLPSEQGLETTSQLSFSLTRLSKHDDFPSSHLGCPPGLGPLAGGGSRFISVIIISMPQLSFPGVLNPVGLQNVLSYFSYFS